MKVMDQFDIYKILNIFIFYIGLLFYLLSFELIKVGPGAVYACIFRHGWLLPRRRIYYCQVWAPQIAYGHQMIENGI